MKLAEVIERDKSRRAEGFSERRENLGQRNCELPE